MKGTKRKTQQKRALKESVALCTQLSLLILQNHKVTKVLKHYIV